ncbi:MAG TPA: hypothetical protein EYP04_08615 [Anaerolineae bacterium]|nr:hypothetical protein [Anaerolineae bacterium]
MIRAKPLEAFTVGERRVISCKVLQGGPYEFVGKELVFVRGGIGWKRIRIEGVSTAGDLERGVYDFQYSGDVIQRRDLTSDCVITDCDPQPGIVEDDH